MKKVSKIGPQLLLQLRIELKYSSPSIWRSVLVPDNTTLIKLHRTIQESMGWHEYHLHEFIIDHKHYGPVDPDDLNWGLAPELISEKRKRLDKVLGHQSTFEYVYDYGDNWQHTITIENRMPLISARSSISCLGGVIVNNNMQVFILICLNFNLLEEFQKLFLGMLLVTLSSNTTSGNIKRCKKCACPVSFIIMRYRSTASFL